MVCTSSGHVNTVYVIVLYRHTVHIWLYRVDHSVVGVSVGALPMEVEESAVPAAMPAFNENPNAVMKAHPRCSGGSSENTRFKLKALLSFSLIKL